MKVVSLRPLHSALVHLSKMLLVNKFHIFLQYFNKGPCKFCLYMFMIVARDKRSNPAKAEFYFDNHSLFNYVCCVTRNIVFVNVRFILMYH